MQQSWANWDIAILFLDSVWCDWPSIDILTWLIPLNQAIIKSPSLVTIKAAINTLKSLIVHSIIQTQHNNWIFITQVEVYYHDKETDDVAQVDKHNEYLKTLTVHLTNRQEGKGSWHELCFWCHKFEIVATGGYYNDQDTINNLGVFLGVTVPSFIGKDLNTILFSPLTPVDTFSCVRMLRSYKKKRKFERVVFQILFFCWFGIYYALINWNFMNRNLIAISPFDRNCCI